MTNLEKNDSNVINVSLLQYSKTPEPLCFNEVTSANINLLTINHENAKTVQKGGGSNPRVLVSESPLTAGRPYIIVNMITEPSVPRQF